MTMLRTDYDVEGTNARRSTAASRSSPAAAQRGAEGAGLDGGDRSRSTIKGAVRHARCIGRSTGAKAPTSLSITPRIHTNLTDVTLPYLCAMFEAQSMSVIGIAIATLLSTANAVKLGSA